ncbi:MAG: LAGLIDADG family homing endonuclease [Nanoarchaeota archaeon]|nr:LAGLIDADG family homing endonuclease [Nanoarchaeota archaeon]
MKKIFCLNFFPERYKDGPVIQRKVFGNRIRFFYKQKRGNYNSCTLLLAKEIILDEMFFVCLGLSIGDGTNNPGSRSLHYNFCNTNFDLINLIYQWLKDYFLIEEKIQFSVTTPITKIEQFTNESLPPLLKNSKKVFKIYKRDRNKKDIIMIQVGNTIFQYFYLNLFNKLKDNILENKVARRAFLKGLFAAEGHVKHSVYGTIESISFAFNNQTEKELAEFVRKCLKKEDIQSKIIAGEIYFCGYEQMTQFYTLGLMDTHKGKKEKFLKLCKNAKICVYFKKSSINSLWKETQHKLAKKWGVCQPMVNRYKKGNFLSLNIAKINFKRNELLKKLAYIKVRSSTINKTNCIEFFIDHLLNDHEVTKNA